MGVLSPAGVWVIDTGHTQVGFSLRHLGISTVHGFFCGFSGAAHIGEDPADCSVELVVDAASVNTANQWRDEHLVGELFLDAARFPVLTFRSTAVSAAADAYRLDGDLTVKGITRPVSFDLWFHGAELFPMDERVHAGFLATTTIRRSDFDCGYGVPLASDDVALRLDVQVLAPVDAVAVATS